MGASSVRRIGFIVLVILIGVVSVKSMGSGPRLALVAGTGQ